VRQCAIVMDVVLAPGVLVACCELLCRRDASTLLVARLWEGTDGVRSPGRPLSLACLQQAWLVG